MTAARTNRVQKIFIRLGLTLAILFGLFTFPTSQAQAAVCASSITVTGTADSGAGTLRQAIEDVCAGGTITFDRSLSGGTITLASTLTINKNITIDGSTLTDQITISGGGVVGVFTNSADLAVKSIKITHGLRMNGGGVYNYGVLNISNSTISDNYAHVWGGGIINSGTLSVINCTFSGNDAEDFGGAIANFNSLTIRNSTFSGNHSDINGSAIGSNNQATIINSTVYQNSGAQAVNNISGNLTIINTILAGTAGGPDCSNKGTITAASKNNLIYSDKPAFPCASSGDIVGSNPLLIPLADNGGPTQTNALTAGSPAIDAGDYATCLSAVDGKDQRSVSREDGGVCDIGAFEAGTYLLPEVSSTIPASWDVLTTSPSSLTVVFNKDVDSDTATDPINYLMASPGINGAFETSGCFTGLAGDDVKITVNSVTYNSNTFTAVLTVNGGHALSNGDYELWVCGTTSIIDSASTKLNNGTDDTRIDFTVNAGTGGGTGGSSSDPNSKLPATGFTPGRTTQRLERTTDYAGLNISLEIPAIGVNARVVGVPQGWDVSWLGHDAGWLNGSAFPTWAGNSVITGHVWDADNRPGLFAGLKDLKYGDAVIIRAFGETYTYEVRETSLVKPGDVKAAFQHEDQPWITLLTCEDFNPVSDGYASRRLVRAVLTHVTAEK